MLGCILSSGMTCYKFLRNSSLSHCALTLEKCVITLLPGVNDEILFPVME